MYFDNASMRVVGRRLRMAPNHLAMPAWPLTHVFCKPERAEKGIMLFVEGDWAYVRSPRGLCASWEARKLLDHVGIRLNEGREAWAVRASSNDGLLSVFCLCRWRSCLG